MKLTALIVLLMTAALSGLCLAGGNEFIEGWNEDQMLANPGTYTASCYAFPYSPGTTYSLTRIEFIGGLVAGTATIEILADSGSGLPDGEILGSGNFDLMAEVGWQGADLDTPVPVVEGTTYYILYRVVIGSQASLASSGDLILQYNSEDCEVWVGPHAGYCWMAMFFGAGDLAEEASSWGGVKALYR